MLRGAGDAAVQPGQHDGAAAAGQPDALDHLGDDADGGVVVVMTGDEEHAGLVTHVDRQGDGHAGEHDGVVEGD